MRSCPRAVVLFALVVCLSGCSSSPSAPRTFRVERGASAEKIARDLVREGLIHHSWSFLIWVRIGMHRGPAIRPGLYQIPPGDSARQVLKLLRKGPPSARITFPEGWTAKQMAAVLEAHNIVSAADFLNVVSHERLEGYLFPDTYLFDQGMDPRAVTQVLRRRFDQMLPPDWDARARALHLTERDLVVLASIVEREARVPEERPVIAGVFLNRLRKHWRLESCATVEYALGAWKPRLTYKDLDVVSPYNTYRHMGLPPGPIGNPGGAALNAAAHPATTDMMFFVSNGNGTHRFSRYYKEHLDAQKKKH